MPYYKGVIDDLIDAGKTDAAKQVAANLLSLRNRLVKQVPPHDPKRQLLSSCGGVFDFQQVIYGDDEARPGLWRSRSARRL